jgi:nitrogen fixation NifU-like protein
MMYNKVVEDCFFQPRHVGVIELTAPLTVHISSGQENQSVTKIDLYLQGTTKGVITRASFKTNGNPYVIAAVEWLCRRIEGQSLTNLRPFNYQILIKELDIPISQSPIAVQIEDIYLAVLALMKKKLEGYLS